MSYIDIVFDGPPSHESGRFVEVENSEGVSINIGEWIKRPDGLWALRIPSPTTAVRVAGGMLPTTLANFEMRALRILEDEQSYPNPNNALIGFLCDAIRLARENERLATSPVKATAVRDSIAPNMQCPVCKGFFWLDKFDGHHCKPEKTSCCEPAQTVEPLGEWHDVECKPQKTESALCAHGLTLDYCLACRPSPRNEVRK